jgi:hypothetical protein
VETPTEGINGSDIEFLVDTMEIINSRFTKRRKPKG